MPLPSVMVRCVMMSPTARPYDVVVTDTVSAILARGVVPLSSRYAYVYDAAYPVSISVWTLVPELVVVVEEYAPLRYALVIPVSVTALSVDVSLMSWYILLT